VFSDRPTVVRFSFLSVLPCVGRDLTYRRPPPPGNPIKCPQTRSTNSYNEKHSACTYTPQRYVLVFINILWYDCRLPGGDAVSSGGNVAIFQTNWLPSSRKWQVSLKCQSTSNGLRGARTQETAFFFYLRVDLELANAGRWRKNIWEDMTSSW